MRDRERYRQTDRQRKREIQTDRQTEKERDTDRQTDRERERYTQTDRQRESKGEGDGEGERKTYKINGQKGKIPNSINITERGVQSKQSLWMGKLLRGLEIGVRRVGDQRHFSYSLQVRDNNNKTMKTRSNEHDIKRFLTITALIRTKNSYRNNPCINLGEKTYVKHVVWIFFGYWCYSDIASNCFVLST